MSQHDLKTSEIVVHDEGIEEKHQHIQHIAGSALLIDKNGTVRKLPIPSNNPNDPLNWKGWEKAVVIFCCCWFCESEHSAKQPETTNIGLAAFNSLAITSGLGAVLEVFFGLYAPQGYGVSDITLLLTLPSLCIGLGRSK